MSIPPAWHPDPTGRHDHRWWDGTRWTEHVADAGVSAVDPIEGAEPERHTHDPAASGTTTGEPSRDATTAPGTEASSVPPNDSWAAPEGAGTHGGADVRSSAPASSGHGWPAGDIGSEPAVASGSDGLAITSLVLGIPAVAFSWVPFLGILAGLAGIVAIVLGAVAMSRVKKSGRKGRGLAIAGLVTGIVAVVLTLLVHVWVFQEAGSVFSDYEQCVELTGDEENCRQMVDLFALDDVTTR